MNLFDKSKRYAAHGSYVTRCFLLSVVVATLMISTSHQTLAEPKGANVVRGNVSMERPSPGQLEITNSPGSIIEWDNFSIGSDELTRFIQQNNTSAVLNRVVGQNPTQILGQLISNGRVFLINRNGVVFGEGSRVDTAGLVASSLNITNEDFLAERYKFAQGNKAGNIVNRGVIQTGKNGDVLIVAPNIENHGLVRSDGGQLILAAGKAVSLASLDIKNVTFEVRAPDSRALNLGELVADGGAIGVFAGTIDHGGAAQANSIVTGENGEIRFVADSQLRTGSKSTVEASQGAVALQSDGDTTISGTVNVAGTIGGKAEILGKKVFVEGATIDASGNTQGGIVRIGGNYQGEGPLPNAADSTVDGASKVSADATRTGDGGEIIVWSDGTTIVDGKLSARGGPEGGDGGLIETSGKRTLDFSRPADVSAPQGQAGTWLLDPEDITIDSGKAESISSALNEGSNVSIETSSSGEGEGNITVASSITKTEGDDAGLAMKAHNKIDVNADITSKKGKLDVSLTAGRNVNINASIATNGGNVSTKIIEVQTDQEPEEESESTESSDLDEDVQADEDSIESSSQENDADDTSAEEGDSEESEVFTADNDYKEGSESSTNDQTEATESLAADTVNADLASSESSGGEWTIEPVNNSNTVSTVTNETVATSSSTTGVVERDESTTAGTQAALGDNSSIKVDGQIKTIGSDIYLDSGEEGTTLVSGVLDASDLSDGGTGGTIRILGDKVALTDDAQVDASGDTGGGTVLIGGGRQGQNSEVRNASATRVETETKVSANATGQGDGGKIVVFADDTANIRGSLSASGGPEGGDGGFVETSGKKTLNVTRTPDVTAPAGKSGEWLVDPYNLDVVPSGSQNVINFESSGSDWYLSNSSGAEIGVDLIESALTGGASVILTTSPNGNEAGDITFREGTNLYYGNTGSNKLTLSSHRDIKFESDTTISGGGGADDALDLFLFADIDEDGSGDVILAPGNAEGRVWIATNQGNLGVRGNNFVVKGGDDHDSQHATVVVGGHIDIEVDENVEILGGQNGSGWVEVGNNVNIQADKIIVEGGTGSDLSVARLTSEGEMNLDSTRITVKGGKGVNNDAFVSSSDELDIDTTTLIVSGGDQGEYNDGRVEAGAEGLNISAKNIVVQGGGDGERNNARLETDNDGRVEIEADSLTAMGGDQGVSNRAYIQAGENGLDVNVEELKIKGGIDGEYNGASIGAGNNGSVTINGGDIVLKGGEFGRSNSARIEGNRAVFVFEDMFLNGGGGRSGNSATIHDQGGGLVFRGDKLTIQGGSGGTRTVTSNSTSWEGNGARISSHASPITLDIGAGGLHILGGDGYGGHADVSADEELYVNVDNPNGTSVVNIQGGSEEASTASLLANKQLRLEIGKGGRKGVLKIKGGTAEFTNASAGASSTGDAAIIVGQGGDKGEIRLEGGPGGTWQNQPEGSNALILGDSVDLRYGSCDGCYAPAIRDKNFALVGISANSLSRTVYGVKDSAEMNNVTQSAQDTGGSLRDEQNTSNLSDSTKITRPSVQLVNRANDENSSSWTYSEVEQGTDVAALDSQKANSTSPSPEIPPSFEADLRERVKYWDRIETMFELVAAFKDLIEYVTGLYEVPIDVAGESVMIVGSEAIDRLYETKSDMPGSPHMAKSVLGTIVAKGEAITKGVVDAKRQIMLYTADQFLLVFTDLSGLLSDNNEQLADSILLAKMWLRNQKMGGERSIEHVDAFVESTNSITDDLQEGFNYEMWNPSIPHKYRLIAKLTKAKSDQLEGNDIDDQIREIAEYVDDRIWESRYEDFTNRLAVELQLEGWPDLG